MATQVPASFVEDTPPQAATVAPGTQPNAAVTPPSFQEDVGPQPPADPTSTQQFLGAEKPAVSGLGPTAKSMAVGAYHFFRDVLDGSIPVYGDPSKILDPQYHGDPKSLWNKYVASPLIAEHQKAQALRKIPGVPVPGTAGLISDTQLAAFGHELATWIPFLGPMSAQAAEQLGQAHNLSDIAGGALMAGTALLGARSAGKPGGATQTAAEVAQKGADIVRATVSKGKVVDAATATLEKGSKDAQIELAKAQANVGSRVGKLVKSISDADTQDSSANGNVGVLKSGPVMNALTTAIDEFGASFGKNPKIVQTIEAIQSVPPKMPWEMMKDLRSQIGQIMYQAAEGSKERAVIAEAYKSLTDQMEGRANDLGQGQQFSAYNRLYSTLMSYVYDGILGKLQSTITGKQFFDVIKNQSNKPELTRLSQDLEQFGLPKDMFQEMLADHKNIYRLVADAESQTGGMIGRFRAFSRHPIVGVASGVPISLIGLPVVGKIMLAMMAASHASNIADAVSALHEMRELGGAPQVTGKFGQAATVQPGP